MKTQPVIRTVGLDYPPYVLHGTTRSSADAFLKGVDVPKHRRQRTMSEWGEDIIYVSEPTAPQAALMFGEHGGAGFGGRVLLEFELQPGAEILDMSHELVRRGSFGRVPFEICLRPAITEDMKLWLNEARIRHGVPPLSKDRLGAVDPESDEFSPYEYLPLLKDYAHDRGLAGIRVQDETILVDPEVIIGARQLTKREMRQIERERDLDEDPSLFSETCLEPPPEAFGQETLFRKPELFRRRNSKGRIK